MGKRNESLDYLRGVLAVGVMAYHYIMVTTGLWGKLGLYAVETFFVLSGLVLGSLYRFTSTGEFKGYLLKRLFRIAPLFWLATIWAAWLAWDRGRSFPIERYLANFSLLFGWIAPKAAITKGGWSIGVEVVFYLVLPAVLLTGVRWWLIGAAALAAWFACTLPGDFIEAWPTYVSPLNHLVFFVAGVAIARYPVGLSKRIHLVILLGGLAIFCLWPAQVHIDMVTGFDRMVLSLCCIGVVFAVYHLAPVFEGWLAAVLAFVGRGSYSIYLLHPLVMVTLFGSDKGNGWIAAAVTLGLSAGSYALLEKPCMRLGAKVARRFGEGTVHSPAAVPIKGD